MPQTKLEIVSKMHSLEKRLDALHAQRRAMTSHHFKGGTVKFTLVTSDAHNNGHEKPMPFDTDLMVAYLTTEIDKLNKESDDLLVELSQIKR